jgi:hypothetical protein
MRSCVAWKIRDRIVRVIEAHLITHMKGNMTDFKYAYLGTAVPD